MSMLAALLRAGYLLFAIAAGGRCLVQWLDEPSRAPLAYALSTFAFGCYLVGFLAVRGGAASPADRRVLRLLAYVELGGVCGVGTLSLLAPHLFPDATVWSGYGIGYGFVPLVIPLVVLGWLRRFPGPVAAPARAPSDPPRRRAHRSPTH